MIPKDFSQRILLDFRKKHFDREDHEAKNNNNAS